jgi:hypothetical protein
VPECEQRDRQFGPVGIGGGAQRIRFADGQPEHVDRYRRHRHCRFGDMPADRSGVRNGRVSVLDSRSFGDDREEWRRNGP